MNSTLDQHAAEETNPLNLGIETTPCLHENIGARNIIPAQIELSSNAVRHNPKSGLNPIADAAGNLFTLIGKLKFIESYPALNKLQADLLEEINSFYDTVKNHGYSLEYTLVCRYILCATLDEIICHTSFCDEGKWEPFRLLAAYKQDLQHQEKFFTIMERIVKEPALYIDLMELIYLCLSMEYKGRYRTMEHGQNQLEQITNSLYKHIRSYRGSYSKILSPTPLRPPRSAFMHTAKRKNTLATIFIVTVCVILTIFISLGYLMDVITNETYQKVAQAGNQA